MKEPTLERRVVRVLFWVQTALTLGLLVLFVATGHAYATFAAIAAAITIACGIAFSRGHEGVRPIMVVTMAILCGVGADEPYLSRELALGALVPTTLAVVLLPPTWIAPITALTFAILAGRGGWRGVYLTPMNLVLLTMITAGLTLARVLADRAVRDSERRRRDVEALTDQLVQAQKMEVVGRLSSGIAHDFNNMLTAVSGFASIARSHVPAEHPAAEPLDEALSAVTRAVGVTRHLLAFARKQPLTRQRADLNAIIRAAEPMLKGMLGGRIRLALALAPTLPEVDCDVGQIEQVLANLALNAHDAMPDGGTVTIATSARSGWVIAVIVDTGTGMSREIRRRLFEPFFTTKEAGKGTGLGLTTSRGIVEQHGGSLLIEGRTGGGTTVELRLPAA